MKIQFTDLLLEFNIFVRDQDIILKIVLRGKKEKSKIKIIQVI